MRLRRGVDGTGKQSAVALARLVQSYLVITAGGQTTVEALDAMEVLTLKMTQRVLVAMAVICPKAYERGYSRTSSGV